MDKKICIKCKQEKNLEKYYKNKRFKDCKDSKCIDCHTLYRLENRDILIKKQREKYIKGSSTARMREWRKNKFGDKPEQKRIKKEKKEREILLKKTEKQYRKEYLTPLKSNIRSTIWNIFNLKRFPKTENSVFYLGCDYDFLKSHIESQFVIGMNWDNKELWHIDHIIPLSFAKTKEDLYLLCHYSNIQPLWADENFKKRGKIPIVTNLHFKKTYM